MTTPTLTKPQSATLTEDQKCFVAQVLTKHSGERYLAYQIKSIHTMNDEYKPDTEGRWMRVALIDGSCYYILRENARQLAAQIREEAKVVATATFPAELGISLETQVLVPQLFVQSKKTNQALGELKKWSKQNLYQAA